MVILGAKKERGLSDTTVELHMNHPKSQALHTDLQLPIVRESRAVPIPCRVGLFSTLCVVQGTTHSEETTKGMRQHLLPSVMSSNGSVQLGLSPCSCMVDSVGVVSSLTQQQKYMKRLSPAHIGREGGLSLQIANWVGQEMC